MEQPWTIHGTQVDLTEIAAGILSGILIGGGYPMPNKPRLLAHRGEILPISHWAKLLRIPHTTIRQRIDQFGWSVERALSTPPDGRFKSSRSGRPARGVPRPCPVLKRHPRGYAYVRWATNGKTYERSMGPWGSEEARAKYVRFSLEWTQGLSEIKTAKAEILVLELIDAYLTHADSHYRKNGRRTGEFAAIKAAMKPLAEIAGDRLTSDFRPDDLRLCQQLLIGQGKSRTTINGYVFRITNCFAWGSSHTTDSGVPLVPPNLVASLREVANIQPHRTAAKEPVKITSVPWATVEATFPHLHVDPVRRAILEALIRVHWLTGMRSSALLAMRPVDLDRTKSEWLYRVGSGENKNAFRGRSLSFWIGPQAQAVLAPLLVGQPNDKPIFRFANASTGADVLIDRCRYQKFVELACKRGNIPHWHPHQLKHSRATEVQRIYEDSEATAAAIGNTPEVAREVYTDDPREAVRRRIARETG